FSLFSALAAAYAGSFFVPALAALSSRLELAVTVAGAVAVGCSVMVYAATRRECWRAPTTAFKFVATALVLGCATVLMTASFSAALGAEAAPLAHALVALATVKLASEAAVFRHLRRRQHTALKRTAILMKGDLAAVTFARFACG